MPLPTGPDFWSPSHNLDAPYIQYDLHSDYTADKGILQVPVAGPSGTACELIRLHAGAMRKTVRAHARRAGLPPVLPSLAVQSPSTEVLGQFSVVPQSPVLASDGTTYVYQVNASYTSYLLNILAAEDGFRLGSAPYTTTSPNTNIISTNQFSGSIL